MRLFRLNSKIKYTILTYHPRLPDDIITYGNLTETQMNDFSAFCKGYCAAPTEKHYLFMRLADGSEVMEFIGEYPTSLYNY